MFWEDKFYWNKNIIVSIPGSKAAKYVQALRNEKAAKIQNTVYVLSFICFALLIGSLKICDRKNSFAQAIHFTYFAWTFSIRRPKGPS